MSSLKENLLHRTNITFPIYCDDLEWNLLNDTGEVQPENILEHPAQINIVRNALETVKEYIEFLKENNLVES